MSFAALMVIPYVLISTLLPLALLVALQVWLCRKGKRLGLILPGLSLVMSVLLSLVLLLNIPAGGSVHVTDGNGMPVTEHGHGGGKVTFNSPGHSRVFQPVAVVFLVSNIPTVIFGGIWLYHKNRKGWPTEVERMNIQDLE